MTINSFEDLVAVSAEEAMSKMLGRDVWKSVTFYFEAGKLANQPENFANLMTKLFGSTAKVLQNMIVETIISKLGATMEPRKDREFKDWIQIARAKFQTSLRF